MSYYEDLNGVFWRKIYPVLLFFTFLTGVIMLISAGLFLFNHDFIWIILFIDLAVLFFLGSIITFIPNMYIVHLIIKQYFQNKHN